MIHECTHHPTGSRQKNKTFNRSLPLHTYIHAAHTPPRIGIAAARQQQHTGNSTHTYIAAARIHIAAAHEHIHIYCILHTELLPIVNIMLSSYKRKPFVSMVSYYFQVKGTYSILYIAVISTFSSLKEGKKITLIA